VQIFKQWPIYLIGRILPAAIGFCGIALYTRMVDPASFGTYALLLSTSFLIGMTCFSWLRVATLRTMSTVAPDDEADFAATIGVSFAGTSLLVAILTIGTLRILNPAIPFTSDLLAAAAAIASGWFELNVTIVQARMHLVMYGLLQAARATSALLASVVLIGAGLKANALLGGFAIGNCAGFAVVATWSPMLRGRFRMHVFRQLFRFGWPSSAASLTYLSVTFQRYMLTIVGGSAAVGVFAATYDFSQQTIGLLMGTVLIAGQPLAFRARDLGRHDELTDQLRNNARLVFAVGLGSSAGLIALAGPIAHLYLGAKFQTNAAILLAISAAAMFVAGFRGQYFEQAFEIARDTRPMAYIAAFRTILAVALSFFLITRWGAIGAASATLGTEFLGLALSIVWAQRLMQVPLPFGSFAKIIAATCAMMVVIALLPSRYATEGFVLAVVGGTLTFAAALTVMHARQIAASLNVQHPLARWLSRT